MSSLKEFDVGDQLGGYRITRKEPLDHLQGTYYEIAHEKTGARHIHVAMPDDNNAFVVAFPTVPKDSTGIAHILEHAVLAGSEKYPVKDPFFSMVTRSLKTFMNAMTSYDDTAYPFSTRNQKDFFNLLDVYLDATFFPRLAETSFKQEGHRLEFDALEDPSSGLRYKGVVFNEMKAINASPGKAVADAIGKGLFPDLTYAHNAGGDPAVMPDLTWEQLKQFHATHYHPSNAYFFTSGDLALDEILTEIEQKALSHFDRIEVDVEISDQERRDKPITYEATFPVAEGEDISKKSQGMVAWVTAKTSDSFQTLAFEVLQEVLMGNAASPLKKALIDSGLGDALADGSGFNTNYKEAVFSVGLKGIEASNAEAVEKVVLDTLEAAATGGLDPEKVESALHQMEIQQKEISNARFPYSLKVYFHLRPAYLYGGDPYRMLQFDQDIEQLRSKIQEGPFLENLIRDQLLDNPHRARIVVSPDREMDKKALENELARLAKIEKGLSEEDKAQIIEETKKLKELQESRPDLSVLPSLELSDIPMQFEDVVHSMEDTETGKLAWFPQPTNGISYITIQADISGLSDNLKDLLPIFAYALTRSGAGSDDYLKMAERIDKYTGGLTSQAGVRELAGSDGLEFRQILTFNGKALSRNHAPFVDILRDILTSVKFEPKRLKDLIAEMKIQYESLIVRQGYVFLRSLAGSKLSPAQALGERLGGLTMLAKLRELSLRENNLDEVIDQLNSIRNYLFRKGSLYFCVTSDEQSSEELSALVEGLLAAIPSAEVAVEKPPAVELSLRHEAKTHAIPVAANAKIFKTVGFGHKDAPALFVLGNLMKATFLHREIREKGGAYGSYSALDYEGGQFILLSWSDPNIVRTFEVFNSVVAEVIKGDIDSDDLKEAILTACASVDPLLSPDIRGRVRFFDELAGYTLEKKEQFKQGLLEVTEEDLRRVAETYLSNGNAAMATLGDPKKIEEANAEMGGIFEVSPAIG
ncbi:MAG: insulinase family protein [Actinobacteria bacterium]|nr:insulinase family protein [Actinomycetota bacterium]